MVGQTIGRNEFVWRIAIVWIAALILGVVYALLREIVAVLATIFGAVLFAVFLDACARILSRRTPLRRRAALTSVLVVAVGLSIVFGLKAGPSVAEQSAQLVERLPQAWSTVEDFVRERTWSRNLLNGEDSLHLLGGNGKLLERLTGIFTTAFGFWGSAAVGIVIGVIIAFDPTPYLRALRRLVPSPHRTLFDDLVEQIAHGLRWWLVGRVSSMLVIGILTYGGLLVLQVPLALTLALLAALLSFVPYLGPVLSTLPAVIVVLAEDPTRVWVVLVLYLAIQLLESNLITPLIEQYALQLPAALLIAAQLAMAALLGLSGMFLSTPLVVVAVIAVQMLYVESALGEPVERIGDR